MKHLNTRPVPKLKPKLLCGKRRGPRRAGGRLRPRSCPGTGGTPGGHGPSARAAPGAQKRGYKCSRPPGPGGALQSRPSEPRTHGGQTPALVSFGALLPRANEDRPHHPPPALPPLPCGAGATLRHAGQPRPRLAMDNGEK